MSATASLRTGNKTIELPVVVGTDDEHAIDISSLRAQTGYITIDEGYGNTGSCHSAITCRRWWRCSRRSSSRRSR
jgi:citrate synthase